jgi:hypothetical protein
MFSATVDLEISVRRSVWAWSAGAVMNAISCPQQGVHQRSWHDPDTCRPACVRTTSSIVKPESARRRSREVKSATDLTSQIVQNVIVRLMWIRGRSASCYVDGVSRLPSSACS